MNQTNSNDQQCFKRPQVDEMSVEQKKYFDGVMSGGVSGNGSKGVVQGATSLGAPFNVLLSSPVLAERLRMVGEYLLFDSSMLTPVEN